MNVLNGPFVVIVLSIGEARGFEFLQRDMWIEGALEKNTIESDPIAPDPTPYICTEFVWETQKKEIRRLRSSQASIKVTCYTKDTHGKQEKIGLVMLNLRTAQPIRNSQLENVEFKWYRLLHVPSIFKGFHPEICLQFTIRDKLGAGNEILPPVEPVIKEPDEIIENETETVTPIYLEDGWIQLRNKNDECQKYLLKFIVGTATNLDLLLDKDQVFNKQNEGYYLAISILGLQINTKFFYKNLHEPIELKDKIIIKLITNTKVLNQIFNDIENVPIYFYYGMKTLATANIDLKEFFKETKETSFSSEQNCAFHLQSNKEIPCLNDRKPYVSMETILEPYTGKSDTALSCGVNSNESVTFKIKYGKDEEPKNEDVTETPDKLEKPIVNLISKSVSSSEFKSYNSNELISTSTVTNIQEHPMEQISSIEIKPEDLKAIKEYNTWRDENKPKVGTDDIEIKFHAAKEIYTSGSETHLTDSNQTLPENSITGTGTSTSYLLMKLEKDTQTRLHPKTLQLNSHQLRQELENCKDEDVITITTPDGQKIMKTVKSLMMESLKACGDAGKPNVDINLSEVAVQTTPRILKPSKPNQALVELSTIDKNKSRIIANFDCPRDEYRLYRLEVIFRTITWRQVFTYDGFQFKINHPKANNFLVITCDLKDIHCKKDNIILDDVYFNIYFISQEENILHLTAMYPPKISVQTFSDQNLVEDFDLYTKLMLNQGTRECNYFAVPNSLWDTEEIVCDIQIDMKIHNVDTAINLFKSQFDLEPIVLDDWFALKTLAELEQWKEKQEILFQDNLKRIQCEKLELLQAEWNVKRMELEIKLQSGLEKCKELAIELTATAEKYRSKNNKDKSEDMQSKVTQLVEEQMKQTIRKLENEKFELLKSIEQLKFEKKDLETKILQQDEALEEMRKTTLSKEQTKLVFKELKNLEEKFNNALMEKAFFKEEWHKALKEAHALKAADQRLIQQEIQKNKAELNFLSLEQFYQLKSTEESEEDTDDNYDSLKMTEITPYVY